MDAVDEANKRAAQQVESALAARGERSGVSNTWCYECGEVIPHKRREVGGVLRCIDCQEAHEQRMGSVRL